MSFFLQVCLGITAVTTALGAVGILFVKAQKHIFDRLGTVVRIADDFRDPTLKEVIVTLNETVLGQSRVVEALTAYMHDAKHDLANGLQTVILAIDNMRKQDAIAAKERVVVAEDLAVAKTVVEGVAQDLVASQTRADKVNGEPAGAAADAASKSGEAAIEEYRGRERRQSVEEWFAKDRRKGE